MAYEFTTIYWRDMLRFVRFRIALVASLIQPALWMALYGAAMSSKLQPTWIRHGRARGRRHRLLSYVHGSRRDCSDHALHQLIWGHHSALRQELGAYEGAPGQPMPRNHIIVGIGLSGVTKSFIQVMVIMALAWS